MMMLAARFAIAIAAPILLVPQVARGQGHAQRIMGAEVRVTAGPERVHGELVAADSDSLWVAVDGLLKSWGAEHVSDLWVLDFKRGSPRIGHILAWAGLVSVGTAIGMVRACGRYRAMESADEHCGIVVESYTVFFGGLAGSAAAIRGGDEWRLIPASEFADLAAYSRFPQGLPESVRSGAVPVLSLEGRPSAWSPPPQRVHFRLGPRQTGSGHALAVGIAVSF